MNITPKVDKSVARLAAVQALFQIELTNVSAPSVIRQFQESNFQLVLDEAQVPEVDGGLFRELVEGATERYDTVNNMIIASLASGWTLGRIESVARSILRVALTELLLHSTTPAIVIISEYVDLARSFLEEKDVSFVNGVLDRLARKLREEEFTTHGPS